MKSDTELLIVGLGVVTVIYALNSFKQKPFTQEQTVAMLDNSSIPTYSTSLGTFAYTQGGSVRIGEVGSGNEWTPNFAQRFLSSLGIKSLTQAVYNI